MVVAHQTSLYAFQKLDAETCQTLSDLMAREGRGMETVTGFLNVVRQMEIERRDRHGSTNVVAQMNGLKGYVPALTQEGASLVVADASRHEHLVRRGYVRIGPYQGDQRDYRGAPRSYYQSAVGGKAQFRQGVAQTVHETWQGVDARTGAPAGENAGLVLGRRASRIATRAMANSGRNDGLPAGEYLRPIFNAKGEVSGYVRSLDAARLEKLPRDENLGRMLGVWAGRILEETVSDETNAELVKTMKAIWEKAQREGETDQFVNVADPAQKDAVIRDAWNTLGWRIREEIAEAFGPETFMVRRDMVDDAIGYRAASVTDFWTGTSRGSADAQKNIREFLGIAGRIEWTQLAALSSEDFVW